SALVCDEYSSTPRPPRSTLLPYTTLFRSIDAGCSPLRAALRGSRQIGATLVTMNLALIAVFLSVLLMGDLIAEVFREFSLTLAADRKSTRLNSSHVKISYAVFCLKKKR